MSDSPAFLSSQIRIGSKAGSIQCPLCTGECVLNRRHRETARGLLLRLATWLKKHEPQCKGRP